MSAVEASAIAFVNEVADLAAAAGLAAGPRRAVFRRRRRRAGDNSNVEALPGTLVTAAAAAHWHLVLFELTAEPEAAAGGMPNLMALFGREVVEQAAGRVDDDPLGVPTAYGGEWGAAKM